jgi:hypothetical protein
LFRTAPFSFENHARSLRSLEGKRVVVGGGTSGIGEGGETLVSLEL